MFCLRELGDIVRVTSSDQQVADTETPKPTSPRAVRRTVTNRVFPKNTKSEKIKYLPLLDMHDYATVQGWLAVRMVILNYGSRMRGRAQAHVSIFALWAAGLFAWQTMYVYLSHSIHWLFFESVGALVVASACLLTCAVAGAECNATAAMHFRYLLKQRLTLHTSGRSSLAPDQNVAKRIDGILDIAGNIVQNSETLRVLGFVANSELTKALLSALVTAVATAVVLVIKPDLRGLVV
jgi:hypothetical protein